MLGSKIYMALPLPAHRRYLEGIDELRALVDEVIRARMHEPGLADVEARSLLDVRVATRHVLGLFSPTLSAASRGSPPGHPMATVARPPAQVMLKERMAALRLQEDDPNVEVSTLVEIRDQIGTFLAAGHETTASLLSFAMHHIAARPDVLEKLHAELTKVGGGPRRSGGVVWQTDALDAAQVEQLVYHTAVLKETLRIDTPGPVVSRDCFEKDAIPGERTGLTIPKGTQVWLSPWLLHRNPRYWDRPDTFDPERWIDPDTHTLRHASSFKHPFQYLPFSAGRRNCIGQRFALLEAKLILATMVRRLEWGPPLGDRLGQQVVRETAITQRPRDGLHLFLKKRLI